MKIVNINIYFGEGSTGKLVRSIHDNLLKHQDGSFVFYGRGSRSWTKRTRGVTKISFEIISQFYLYFARLTGLRFYVSFFETFLLIRYLKKLKPEIVHLHCMNCDYVNPYMLLKYLKKNKINVVVTNHADVTFTANCDHAYECEKWKTGCGKCPNLKEATYTFFWDNTALSWNKMRKAFVGFDKLWVTSVSSWTDERARMSPFFQGADFSVITNGIDTSVFKYQRSETFETKYGICNKKIILHVTPDFDSPLKGGEWVLKLAEMLPDCFFVVVGVNSNVLSQFPNLVMLPHTQDAHELSLLYSNANVTLLTSKRETFSLVCAESLCCGTPVVGFKCGGPERIALEDYSQFVDYGDISSLKTALKDWINREISKDVVAGVAALQYSSDRMAQEYRRLYTTILANHLCS